MSFRETPKVELHLHLEGGAPPEFIRRLAAEKKIDLSGVFRDDGSYRFEGFDHFLRTYEAATQVLTGPEEFARLVTAVLEESASHGVIYSECFLSPDFCGGSDLGAWREYLAAMIEAAEAAERAHGIVLRGVVTCIRHLGPERAKRSTRCAAETAGDWITGFGMGGAEMMGEPGDFAYAFDMAREAGLRITCHAGEWGGAQMVRKTLDDLAPERIGHGVMAIEDPDLVERLAKDGIVLEVCPGSNVALGVAPGWAAHPIKPLRDAGVIVTVSTDDPPFFHTDMTLEYDNLHRTFGWEEEDFRALNMAAIDAAFCADEIKTRVKQRLQET